MFVPGTNIKENWQELSADCMRQEFEVGECDHDRGVHTIGDLLV